MDLLLLSMSSQRVGSSFGRERDGLEGFRGKESQQWSSNAGMRRWKKFAYASLMPTFALLGTADAL